MWQTARAGKEGAGEWRSREKAKRVGEGKEKQAAKKIQKKKRAKRATTRGDEKQQMARR